MEALPPLVQAPQPGLRLVGALRPILREAVPWSLLLSAQELSLPSEVSLPVSYPYKTWGKADDSATLCNLRFVTVERCAQTLYHDHGTKINIYTKCTCLSLPLRTSLECALLHASADSPETVSISTSGKAFRTIASNVA